jgi:hypothetical protein
MLEMTEEKLFSLLSTKGSIYYPEYEEYHKEAISVFLHTLIKDKSIVHKIISIINNYGEYEFYRGGFCAQD